MQPTLIPAEAADYAAGLPTRDLLGACREARAAYYNTPLTAADLTVVHWALAVLVYEAELASRGLHVIAAGPDLGPDPAFDPRPEDIPGGPDGDCLP